MKVFVSSFRLWFLVLLVVMAVGLGSCKTVKTERKQEERVLSDIHKGSPVFKSYSAKLDIEYGGMTFSGTMRVIKDKAIWVSAGKFGFEGARLMLTKDSVWFINKLEREYFVGGYDFFNGILGFKVSYDMVEGLLLGKDFADYDISASSYSMETDKDIVRIMFEKRANLNDGTAPILKQNLFYNKALKIIIRNYFEVIGYSNSLDVYYDSYLPIEGYSFPSNMRINAFAGKTMKVGIKAKNQKINDTFDMPFSAPKGYNLIK
ncbi:MAG: DUF4292 domain-containing protein [Bacteroidales bacterium]|nr:DUF4292 domain-containing protein [Bacteroidales bacterium]MDD4684340.1 DUF4292 domain-containing protein [Bacteroidales bacterium]